MPACSICSSVRCFCGPPSCLVEAWRRQDRCLPLATEAALLAAPIGYFPEGGPTVSVAVRSCLPRRDQRATVASRCSCAWRSSLEQAEKTTRSRVGVGSRGLGHTKKPVVSCCSDTARPSLVRLGPATNGPHHFLSASSFEAAPVTRTTHVAMATPEPSRVQRAMSQMPALPAYSQRVTLDFRWGASSTTVTGVLLLLLLLVR